jgi:hypothetical protein
MEFDVNIYAWGNMVRQGIQTLFNSCHSMVLSYGFCIEGRHESELPENLFGCGRIIKLDPAAAIDWDEI